MSVIEDVRQQRRALLSDYRMPVAVLVDDEALRELRCEAAYMTLSPFSVSPLYGASTVPADMVGMVFGLEIRMSDRPGALVIPEDWGGFGQGQVRG